MSNISESKPSWLDTRKPSTTEHELPLGDRILRYTASAEWQTLREKEEPVGEMFHVAYLAKDVEPSQRPITFIFNGGPGAASAYLHLGALGPKRVYFDQNGSLPKPP